MKRYQVIIRCRNRQYFDDFNEAVEATKKQSKQVKLQSPFTDEAEFFTIANGRA